MLSVADLFQLELQRNGLINNYEVGSINNAAARQNLAVNQGIQLGDNTRSFERMFRDFGSNFSRRGLETSGIKNRVVDRTLADEQRGRDRLRQGFTSQGNFLEQQQQQLFNGFQRDTAQVDAFATAARQELASQIRGIT